MAKRRRTENTMAKRRTKTQWPKEEQKTQWPKEEEQTTQWPKETRRRKQTMIYKHIKLKYILLILYLLCAAEFFSYMEDGTILL
jgi:hypothetical protein